MSHSVGGMTEITLTAAVTLVTLAAGGHLVHTWAGHKSAGPSVRVDIDVIICQNVSQVETMAGINININAIAQPAAILMNAGMTIQADTKMIISDRPVTKKCLTGLVGNNLFIKTEEFNEQIEIIAVQTRMGRQLQESVSVAVIWDSSEFSSTTDDGGADICITPGEVMNDTISVLFVMAEVKPGRCRAAVTNTLRRGVNWLQMADYTLLDLPINGSRRLFNLGAKLAGQALGEFIGNYSGENRHDALYHIASTLTDQFRVLSEAVSTHTFMTYSTETMKLISHVDKFTCLLLMMLSITADKDKILPTCKRSNLGIYHNHIIQWLEMDIPRR